MDLLREFTTWVASQTGMVVSENLWAGHSQEYAPARTAVIMEMPGTPSQPRLRGNVGEYSFQIVSRDEHPIDAHDLALLIHDAIADTPGVDLDEWEVHVCDAVNEPYELGFDSKKRFEWVALYTVRATHKAAWAAV